MMLKIFLSVLILVELAKAENVTISLFATDLNGCDATSACDAVVTILCQTTLSDWKECGKTKEMKDDNYPVWPEKFVFDYVPSQQLRWRFDIVDQDLFFNDPIGSVTVSAAEFLAATEQIPTMKHDLNGRGFFYIHRRSAKEG